MSYAFTIQELQNIQSVLTAAQSTGNFVAVYQEILYSITDETFSPKDGVDPAVWNWVNGALQVNANSGDYASFIRTYSEAQYVIRFGSVSETSLQTVSNAVCEAVANDILSSAVLPSLGIIGETDAGRSINGYFQGDTAGWSGNPLFIFLGDDSFYRQNILNKDGTYDILAFIKSSTTALGEINSLPDLAYRVATVLATNGVPGLSFLQMAYAAMADTAAELSSTYAGIPIPHFITSYNIRLGRVNADDMLSGTGSDMDLIHGGGGNDTIYGGEGSDIIDGGSGNDTLRGGDSGSGKEDYARDVISGGAGDDDIYLHTDIHAVFGDAEERNNIVNNYIDVVDGKDESYTIHFSFEFQGFTYSTTLTGSELEAALERDPNKGYLGFDTGARITYHEGGAYPTQEIFASREGTRLIFSIGDPSGEMGFYLGGVYDFQLEAFVSGDGGGRKLLGGSGADHHQGDALSDQIVYLASSEAVNVDLELGIGSGGDAEGDTYESVEQVVGSQFNDTLTGNGDDNFLYGAGGDDTFYGGAGDDVFDGQGGANNVVRYDGSLSDYVFTQAADGSVTATGTASGVDTLIGISRVFMIGDAQWFDIEDILTPVAGPTSGTSGDDILVGTTGDDVLVGLGGNDTLTGDGGDDLLIGGSGADELNGGSGNDTVSYDASLTGVVIDIADGSATGGDATGDTISGVERIQGSTHADRFVDSTETMTFEGGEGDDVYEVNNYGTTVVEQYGSGTDEIVTTLDIYNLGRDVENLTYVGASDFVGRGNSLRNIIASGTGNDTLTGGTGADTLIGGDGDDTYYVDGNDTIVEDAGEGTDTVYSVVSIVLGAHIENAVLSSSLSADATGNALDNVLLGNQANNVLKGADGDDTLDGGIGGDSLLGGAGNDVYYVDTLADSVTEVAGNGVDTIRASISWTLEDNVEKLILIGADDLNGTGNGLANTLTGNGLANRLDGDLGADILIGEDGNDVYIVDNAGDTVIETAGNGTDTVQSSVSWVLGTDLEKLTLTGAADLNGTGNGLANVLSGNDGANTLDGKAGADAMTGGAGNDTYVVDNAGDTTTETSGGGTDLVQASISWNLAGELEKLTLTGSSAINATGNGLANTLNGNSGANILDGGAGIDMMIGGAGNDTYIVDNSSDVVTEAASGGTDLIQASVSYILASGSEVETLTLTGTASINAAGNAFANTLNGNSGANVLDGGAGIDTMIGGAGNDTYVVDNSGDVVTEGASSGTDLIQASVSYTLATGSEVEKLTLTGTASINATGNALANTLNGNSGANILDGGAGIDTMIGGAGNDIYIVDDLLDETSEVAGGGTDTVQAAISWTLDTEIEKLLLVGTADITGTGNTSNNTLTGNAGDNLLNGGAGTDILVGGAGDDTYIVDTATDTLTEAVSGGVDTVQSSVTLTLVSGTTSEIENLTLTGTTAINGTGNELNNVLTGNSAANTLTGGDGNDTLNGGGGSDTMIGGLGNDIFVVASTGDIVTEAVSEGTDTVQSSITYTLGANVEKLTLTGTTAINGTGNTLSNTITGNSANNVLTGDAGNDTLNGSTGADTMIGGIGNDTYVVDVSADVVTEAAGEGTDTVQSSITLTLGANVERLTLTGTTAINGTGNSLDNILIGNSASNTLNGGSGVDTLKGMVGADTLTGGTGIDTFVFATGDDADTITDFDAVGSDHDIIDLTGLASVTSYADLTANHMTQSGANVLIDGLSGDTILIKNVTLAAMVADNFLF